MKNWLLLGVLVVMGPLYGQGWPRLERTKPGTTVVIQTRDGYGSSMFDRCKLLAAEASTLSCVDVQGPGGRMTFPAGQVDAVYEVHKSHAGMVGAILGLSALAALLIASAVTGNPGFLLLALIGSGVAASALLPPQSFFGPRVIPPRYPYPLQAAYPDPWSAPAAPWAKGETGRLVYVRHTPFP